MQRMFFQIANHKKDGLLTMLTKHTTFLVALTVVSVVAFNALVITATFAGDANDKQMPIPLSSQATMPR